MIGVYNEAGELIQSLPVSQYSQAINNITLVSGAITALNGVGSQSVILFNGVPIGTWNGLDATGNPATNGNYFIKVSSTDPLGMVTTVTQRVTVNRAIYQVTIKIYNQAGEVVRNLLAYTSDPGPNQASQMQLSTTAFAPTSGGAVGNIPNQLTLTLNNGTILVWDGRSDNGSIVTTGQYFIEIHSQDGQGGETVVTKQVTVNGENSHYGDGNITVEPNLLSPSTGYEVQFVSDLSQNLTLTLRVYDIAGELVEKSLSGLAGSGRVWWDGSSLASGLYFAVVEVLDVQGKRLSQKTLNLVVLR
jgi:flagellar hook assembly protein FlgD